MNIDLLIPKIKSQLGSDIIELLKENNGIISGGCLRDLLQGTKIKDWDLFFIEEDKWISFNNKLKNFEEEIIASKTTKTHVRKFIINGNKIDSIYYPYVGRLE